jgi:hypothetical protein
VQHPHGPSCNSAHAGEEARRSELETPAYSSFRRKKAIFPFNLFLKVDPILGPEMRSTGEILGLRDLVYGLKPFCGMKIEVKPL